VSESCDCCVVAVQAAAVAAARTTDDGSAAVSVSRKRRLDPTTDDVVLVFSLSFTLSYSVQSLLFSSNHRCAVAQPCINGDSFSQWRMPKFDPRRIETP